jgi:hypothetical protein
MRSFLDPSVSSGLLGSGAGPTVLLLSSRSRTARVQASVDGAYLRSNKGRLLLPTRCRQASFSFAYPEPPEPLEIFGGVVTVSAGSSSRERERSEALPKSKPICGYAEFNRSLTDCE